MTRSEILEAARKCVSGDRDEDYGPPENSFGIIAEFWTAYLRQTSCTDIGIFPEDVAALMTLLKIARIASGQAKADNWVDGCGYMACGGELQTHTHKPPF